MSENNEHVTLMLPDGSPVDVTINDTTHTDPDVPPEKPPDPSKEEQAKSIAEHLLKHSNPLGIEIELETIAEDDQALAGLVKAALEELRGTAQVGSKQVVHSAEDIEKLPPGSRDAIKSFVKNLGGIPEGGLFSVALNSIAGIEEAVDTIIENGTVNLGTIVCSRLAAHKAEQIAQAVGYLVQRAQTINDKAKPTADDKAVLA